MSTVVDDTNRNIVWSGSSWRNGDDLMTDRYFNSTFRHSVFNGEYASISWRGKDIAVYGARRENHGIYSVSLDNGEPQYFSGYASGSGQYQAALYATSGLADGEHTLKVTNENSRNAEQYPNYVYLDIDFFALTGELITQGASSSSPSATSSSSSTSPTESSASATSSSESATSSSAESSTASSEGSSASDSQSSSSTVSSSTATETTTVNLTTGQYTDTGSPVSATATEGVEEPNTTGTPNLPPATTSSGDIPGGEANANDDGSSNKTTIAVSVSVISVAVVVIATVLGLYLYKRRKAKREQEELQQAENLMTERSWSY